MMRTSLVPSEENGGVDDRNHNHGDGDCPGGLELQKLRPSYSGVGVDEEEFEDEGDWGGGGGQADIVVVQQRRPCWSLLAAYLSAVGLFCFVLLSARSGEPQQHDNPAADEQKAPKFQLPRQKHPPSSSKIDRRSPLSNLDPVIDLGLANYSRPSTSMPPYALRKMIENVGHKNGNVRRQRALPTNAWYQNMLLLQEREPSIEHRANTVPYIVDAVGMIPGLRVHPSFLDANDVSVQLAIVEKFGLTVGAAPDQSRKKKRKQRENKLTRQYLVEGTTPLGLTLAWEFFPMSSTITKGMPFATMRFNQSSGHDEDGILVFPTVASEISLGADPVADGATKLRCHKDKPSAVLVEREVELFFKESDFGWLVFFSERVMLMCFENERSSMLQVINRPDGRTSERPLYVRIALSNPCTSNADSRYCFREQLPQSASYIGQEGYGDLLRKHANLYPGPDTRFDYAVDDKKKRAALRFNWDVQDMTYSSPGSHTALGLLVFALPHHIDMLAEADAEDPLYCVASLSGPACLLKHSTWELEEGIPEISFWAPRAPAPWSIGMLSDSLKNDLQFTLPEHYRRGAGDTYFSGKLLAKLGRIILVSEEILALCRGDTDLWVDMTSFGQSEYNNACSKVDLPSSDAISKAKAELRSSVEVWINGTAETPFVYDPAWGGVVSCGCIFNGEECENKAYCAAFTDPGLNFGNGFYNDMHFHYGYFVYAAAVVSHFDPQWGRTFFERVLLLIRNIANPSENDGYFQTSRHKDWYHGHSWASGGIAGPPNSPIPLNGRNQESSSEAIAAYEAVALYRSVMMSAWDDVQAKKQKKVAIAVREIGQVLLSTELRSAKKYWHIVHDQSPEILPHRYPHYVVGILWQTAAQFLTWFGNAPYFIYGIQLLPLTPISEDRDGVGWIQDIYSVFAESCDSRCVEEGWSVLQLAALATIGHQREAAASAVKLSPDVFDKPGGSGHSLSNTLWFIATRPVLAEPLAIAPASAKANKSGGDEATEITQSVDPGSTDGTPSGDAYSGPSGEAQAHDSSINEDDCPPCSHDICTGPINKCPAGYTAPFLCTAGPSSRGCSPRPWSLSNGDCNACCKVVPECNTRKLKVATALF